MFSLTTISRRKSREKTTAFIAPMTVSDSTTDSYGYDADSRLLTLNHTLASGSLNYAYTLNNVGDRTSRSETLGSGTTTDNYSYDAIDQVTGVGYGSGRNVGYNYDAVGNRMAVSDSISGTTSYTTNNLNQYTNIAAQVPQYDANGNLTNLNGWTYAYDAQNRLLSAQSASSVEVFSYDPQNRCVSRSLTVSGTTTTTNFIYDGWQLAEELNSSGVEQALYVSGARTDELLYKATPTNTVFYQHDALGSTTALTDASGNLVERYTYDVFGKPSIYDASGNPLTASAYNNRFLFTGREYLQEVGLYDYRNRIYSADLGRFLQVDPIGFAAGDCNIYRYVGNDAVNLVDLFGLCCEEEKNLMNNAWHIYLSAKAIAEGTSRDGPLGVAKGAAAGAVKGPLAMVIGAATGLGKQIINIPKQKQENKNSQEAWQNFLTARENYVACCEKNHIEPEKMK